MDEATPQDARPRARSMELAEMPSQMSQGLGIDTTSDNHTSQESSTATHPQIQTVPALEDAEQLTPNSAYPLVSPPSTGGLSGSTQFEYSPISTFSPYKPPSKHSHTFSTSTVQPPLPTESVASLLPKRHSASVHSAYGDFTTKHKCENIRGVKGSRTSWFSVTTIILSVYSTIFSGIFFFIAVIGPSYSWVRTDGKLTASSAAFLTSIFAKTIELSFVTVIIALIGQELSRRASSSHRRSGVTLAELSMRSWIVQPGTMISRWDSVRYAALTTLGFLSVIAALLAMLYTSAATALVQPRLRFDKWTPMEMQGSVMASFANNKYIGQKCHHPLPQSIDIEHRAETRISIEHAAMAYHNYYDYLKIWSERNPKSQSSNGRQTATERPYGTALLENDTSVIAPWVEDKLNYRAAMLYNETLPVVINNVSLAFPHTGVRSASRDTSNKVMQPEDLDGLGLYRLNASVPSPVVHVLCATVSEDHIAPLIFEKWNATNETINGTTWPGLLTFTNDRPSPYLGGSDLDDIFGWGDQYGDGAWPPIFPTLPKDYNTMVNSTMMYNRTSIYVLGKSPAPEHDNTTEQTDYFLCQLRVTQTPYCYTSYQASAQGATLEAVCGDEESHHPMQYISKVPSTASVTPDKDWPSVATQWAFALALNDGAFGGDSSNARLLSQLLLRQPGLDPDQPSLAEALAVLAGCTLLQSTMDAPFRTYWDYPVSETNGHGILLNESGVYEKFNATIHAQMYASGGTEPYQKAFHIVLLGVFALNVLALLYFALHKTWYTDFSETPTLFSLAVNSPPSEAFSGCCGTGPQGKDYGVAWTLEQDDGHVFVHSGGRRDAEGREGARGPERLKRRKAWRSSIAGSPVVRNLGRFGRGSREG